MSPDPQPVEKQTAMERATPAVNPDDDLARSTHAYDWCGTWVPAWSVAFPRGWRATPKFRFAISRTARMSRRRQPRTDGTKDSSGARPGDGVGQSLQELPHKSTGRRHRTTPSSSATWSQCCKQ